MPKEKLISELRQLLLNMPEQKLDEILHLLKAETAQSECSPVLCPEHPPAD